MLGVVHDLMDNGAHQLLRVDAVFMEQDAPEWERQPEEVLSVRFFRHADGLIRRVLLLWLLLFLFFTIVTCLL